MQPLRRVTKHSFCKAVLMYAPALSCRLLVSSLDQLTWGLQGGRSYSAVIVMDVLCVKHTWQPSHHTHVPGMWRPKTDKQTPSILSDTLLGCLATLCFVSFIGCEYLIFLVITLWICVNSGLYHCPCLCDWLLWGGKGKGGAGGHIRGVPAGGGGELWGVLASNGNTSSSCQAYQDDKVSEIKYLEKKVMNLFQGWDHKSWNQGSRPPDNHSHYYNTWVWYGRNKITCKQI